MTITPKNLNEIVTKREIKLTTRQVNILINNKITDLNKWICDKIEEMAPKDDFTKKIEEETKNDIELSEVLEDKPRERIFKELKFK
jgi:hypothetical protein